MIRVALLDRQRRWSPWSKALLSALVVCGGLYGLHLFFPALAGSLFNADFAFSPVAQQEHEAASSPVSKPEPTAQKPTPSPVVQQESTKPIAEQEATPKPVVVQRDTLPSSVAQQEAASSPVQEAPPNSVREIAAKPKAISTPPTPSQAPAPQRSTACHQVMRIDEQVPAGIRVASLNCNSSGEYWLEGTSPSHNVLREFRLGLQALPSRVSFSTWREERALRFAFQGRFADQDPLPLTALSSGQAEQFFGKVAGWANASGLDSLSIHKPIHRPLSPTRTHQRQKLRGLGSPQQIDAFLQQLQQVKAVATLGEVLLMPVKSDESGWVQARLYAAVDIIVEGP